MSTASRPQEIFSITSARVSEGGIALDQGITSGLVDHRGVIEMPAYGVLAESATSGAYWRTFAEPVGTVQSFLTLCAGVPARWATCCARRGHGLPRRGLRGSDGDRDQPSA